MVGSRCSVTNWGSMRKTLLIVVIIGGFASVLNFVYQAFVASRIDPAAFSLFAAFMTLIVTIAAGAAGLQVVTARSVSTQINWSPAPRFLDRAARQTLIGTGGLVILAIALSPLVASLLRVDAWVVAVISLYIPIAALEALAIGKIQGSGSVAFVALIGLAIATFKLVSAGAVLALGGGASGLIFGLIAVNLAILIAITPAARTRGSVEATWFQRQTWILVVSQLTYWAFASIDIFIVRVRLEEVTAGQFAAAATLAKIVLFVPGLLIVAILPWAGQRFGQRKRRQRLAAASLALGLSSALAAVVGVALLGPIVIEQLFGPEYEPANEYLLPLALAYVPIALSGILLQFHFTSQRSMYALTTVVTLMLAVILVSLGPPSPSYFIIVMVGVGLLQMVTLLGETLAGRTSRSAVA